MSELTHVKVTASGPGFAELQWALSQALDSGGNKTFMVSRACGNEFALAFSCATPIDPAHPTPPPIDKPFMKTQFYEWDWTQRHFEVYTGTNKQGAMNPQGPIGPDGLVVIAFTPQATSNDGVGSVSIAPFPGDLQPAIRTVSVSTTWGDFTQPLPWTRTDVDVTLQFTIGASGAYPTDVYPPLVAGQRYFINVATRDAQGESTAYMAGRACDMIIQVQHPG